MSLFSDSVSDKRSEFALARAMASEASTIPSPNPPPEKPWAAYFRAKSAIQPYADAIRAETNDWVADQSFVEIFGNSAILIQANTHAMELGFFVLDIQTFNPGGHRRGDHFLSTKVQIHRGHNDQGVSQVKVLMGISGGLLPESDHLGRQKLAFVQEANFSAASPTEAVTKMRNFVANYVTARIEGGEGLNASLSPRI